MPNLIDPLFSASAGDKSHPVYFSNGLPIAMTDAPVKRLSNDLYLKLYSSSKEFEETELVYSRLYFYSIPYDSYSSDTTFNPSEYKGSIIEIFTEDYSFVSVGICLGNGFASSYAEFYFLSFGRLGDYKVNAKVKVSVYVSTNLWDYQ